jgi:hypothetical protein
MSGSGAPDAALAALSVKTGEDDFPRFKEQGSSDMNDSSTGSERENYPIRCALSIHGRSLLSFLHYGTNSYTTVSLPESCLWSALRGMQYPGN